MGPALSSELDYTKAVFFKAEIPPSCFSNYIADQSLCRFVNRTNLYIDTSRLNVKFLTVYELKRNIGCYILISALKDKRSNHRDYSQYFLNLK